MRYDKAIDLFAGMGGIRLGFEKAGFSTVFANDFDRYCAETYNLNFNGPKMEVADIKEVASFPEFDILLGGFPCQPYSVAGNRKGMKDKRGTLFYEIVRILSDKRPVGFFLENVKNLSGSRFKQTFSEMVEQLESADYDVRFAILNTMEYGDIPQNRERVYIVGFRKGTGFIDRFTFPNRMELTTSVDDILEKEVPSRYYYAGTPLHQKLNEFGISKGIVYQWRRRYVRENKSGVCPTLTANMGTGGHNVPIIRDRKGIRKLTPRECASLQGFPKNFKFPNLADSRLYKQIGNSVSIPVVSRIAVQMREAIVG